MYKNQLHVNVNDRLFDCIDRESKEVGAKRAVIVRETVDEYIDQWEPSFLQDPLAKGGNSDITVKFSDEVADRLRSMSKGTRRDNEYAIIRSMLAKRYSGEQCEKAPPYPKGKMVTVSIDFTENELDFIDSVMKTFKFPSRQGYMRDAVLTFVEQLYGGDANKVSLGVLSKLGKG